MRALLAIGLALGLAACGDAEASCAETLAALTPPPTPEDAPLPEGRYGLGMGLSRALLDASFAEATREANRHLTGSALARLPEGAREVASGRLRIRIDELRYQGPGECPGCVDLALRASGTWSGPGRTIRVALRARPTLTSCLVPTPVGIEVHAALEALPGSVELSVEPRAGRPAARSPGPLLERRRRRRGAVRARLAERSGSMRAHVSEEIEARLEAHALAALHSALRERLAAGPITTLDQSGGEDTAAAPVVRRAELHPLAEGWFLGADLAGYPTDLVAPAAPRSDVTLVVPGAAVLRAIAVARTEGVIPARVSRQGRPAPGEDGLVLLPRDVRLGEGDGRVTVRFGRDQSPCGFLDVSARVRAVVEAGEVRLTWDDVTAEEAGQAGHLASAAIDLYEGFWDAHLGGVTERSSHISIRHGERTVNAEVMAIRMSAGRVEVDLRAPATDG